MTNDRINPSKEEIKRIIGHISSLSGSERELVREVLCRLKSDGIGREELHRELWSLRKKYAISEVDMRNIEKGFFGED